MTTLDYPQAAELERLLDSRVPPADAGRGQHSRVEGPIVRGERSVIYRAICPGFDGPLLIKRLYEPGRTARSQYDALFLAKQRLDGQKALMVPEAYPYLLDDGFIMMDWFMAPTVGELLKDRTLPASSVAAVLRRTGQWLRAFHGNPGVEHACLRTDQMMSYILELLSSRRSRRGIAFDGYLALLKCTAPTVAKIAVPASYSHGDFKPDNVLIDGDRVITVDIGRVFKAPIIHDLVHFLVHLDLHLLHPGGWRLLPWKRRLRRAFLGGYRLEITADQRLAMAWLALQRTLQSFFEVAGGFDKSQSWRRRLFLRACYSRYARVRARELRFFWEQMEASASE